MANYNIDIGVKVQSQQLDQFNKKLKSTATLIKNANQSIKNYEKRNLEVVKSINGVNTALNQASKNFREVAVGTPQATRAAKEFVKAEQLVNKTLAEQQKLLENTRRKQQGKEFTMGLRRQGFKKNQIKQSDGSFINQRRAELQIINRAATLEDRINQTLAKRGKILSANGKQIINNNRARSAGVGRGNTGNLASSAIIGGTFPLLFGQTGAAATGGAIGGATGGLIGGQFGFALSLAGTAIGQYIDQQDKLNRSITKVNSLFVTMGNGVGFTAKEIKKLGKEIGVTAEEIVQMVDASKRFGKEGSDALISFFGADFSKRMGQIDAIAQVDSLANSLKAIQALGKDLTLEEEFRLINMARQEGSLAVQIELQRILLELQHKQNLQEAERIKLGTRFNIQMAKAAVSVYEGLTGRKGLEVKNLNQIIQDQIDETIRKYEEMDEKLLQQIEKIKALAAAYSDGRLTIADEIDSINKKLKIMMDVQTQVVEISREIKDSFAESFKEVVKGTMTVTDAFRNMLNRIADYFLDTAAQLLAMQLQKGFLGFMSNLFPSLKTSKHGVDGKRADGGPVRSGGTYLVGERGPELFTPGISGGITPNHAFGGSTSVVVNVDASGTSIEGDEPGGEELGRLIGAVVQSELIKEKRPGGLLA